MRATALCKRAAHFLAIIVALGGAARAEERMLPTPRVTIYPGDRIDDAVLEEQSFASEDALDVGVATTRGDLLGKLARRTLLPGRPILMLAVDTPRAVSVGAAVKILFIEHGLVITAFGVAQQNGGVGDLIRVRNQDSGLFVSGRVAADGSIHVGDG
jgi:flagella basal body P-ring formation protein FlgA